jgi:hypothetical protein
MPNDVHLQVAQLIDNFRKLCQALDEICAINAELLRRREDLGWIAMDPALVAFDFAKASAILADMVESYLAVLISRRCQMAVNMDLLYSADSGQALSGLRYLRYFRSLARPLFSSGSALWLSHYGIRRMKRPERVNDFETAGFRI